MTEVIAFDFQLHVEMTFRDVKMTQRLPREEKAADAAAH